MALIKIQIETYQNMDHHVLNKILDDVVTLLKSYDCVDYVGAEATNITMFEKDD